MPKQFISFQTAGKGGEMATVVLAVDKIIAVERQLSQGCILISGAAWTISPGDAIRISRELLEDK